MEETVDDIWHVFSDGTKADIPFDTDEDKVYGWNSVAICAEIAGVKVWVVTVNDTHFHSLVKGSAERAERYRCVLQQRLQRHFFKGRKVSDLSWREKYRLFRSARAFIAFLYVRKEDEAAMKQEIYRDYLESRSIQELRKVGNKFRVNYCGKTLVNAPFDIRLKVAGRLLKDGLASKNASLAKALFLKPDDLHYLL